MLKDILNHPSLREAADRCKKIEDTQKQILDKVDALLRKVDPDCSIIQDPDAINEIDSKDIEPLSLEVIDLSRRVYFLETSLAASEKEKWKILNSARSFLAKHQLLLAAISLGTATFFGIYTLFILNS